MTSMEGDDIDETNDGRTGDRSEFSMGSPSYNNRSTSTSLQPSSSVNLTTPGHTQSWQQRQVVRSSNSWSTGRHEEGFYDMNNNPTTEEHWRRQQADHQFIQQQQQHQATQHEQSASHGQYSAAAAWPPRSYTCNFCRRDFNSAQALGGHMNVHRRDRARLRHASGQPAPVAPAAAAHFDSNYYSTPSAAVPVSTTSPSNDTAPASASSNIEATNLYGRVRDEPQPPHPMIMPIDHDHPPPWSFDVAAATARGTMASTATALIPFVVGTPANLMEAGNSSDASSTTSVSASLTFLRSAGTSAFGNVHLTMDSNEPRAYHPSGSGHSSTPDARAHSLSSRLHSSASGSSGSATGTLDLELRLGRRSSVELNDVDEGAEK